MLHVIVGTHTLVEMTWPYPTGFLVLMFRAGVAGTVLPAYSDLRLTSLFVLLVYTYILLLGSPESQRCLQLNTWLLR